MENISFRIDRSNNDSLYCTIRDVSGSLEFEITNLTEGECIRFQGKDCGNKISINDGLYRKEVEFEIICDYKDEGINYIINGIKGNQPFYQK